jgi:hypothetical protein
LTYGGIELLSDGRPRLGSVQSGSGMPETPAGSFEPESKFDEQLVRLEQIWSMGRLVCQYHSQDGSLGLSLTFTNTSDVPLSHIQLSALKFSFPESPGGTGWYQKLHTTSEGVDDVPAVVAAFGEGTLAAVAENTEPEVSVSLHSTYDKEQRIYSLNVGTVTRSARDFINADSFTLEPGKSVTFDVSVRLGPADNRLGELAKDVFAKYRERFPRVLKWDDRRPIGMLTLANSDPKTHSPTNPRGWFGDPKLDAMSLRGKANFRQRVLAWVAASIKECRARGAQGLIVWDVEGEEFQPLVYVGDPRRVPELAPEFDAIADEFFRAFTAAGFKTGVCIRPSRIYRPENANANSPWRHGHMAFDPVEEMADKIDYAKARWGCTLFYIDSNTTWACSGEEDEKGEKKVTSWTMRADAMRRLAEKHADVLLIPEFQYPGYYSHVAGYKELRNHAFGGHASTPERVLTAYPDAFSVINLADGKLKERRADLIAAVKRGDILMFRGWYNAPENASVPFLYREAAQGLGRPNGAE